MEKHLNSYIGKRVNCIGGSASPSLGTIVAILTEEEILAKAKRDYPKGTVYLSAYNKQERIAEGSIKEGSDGYYDACGGYVYDRTSRYYSDGWAPIIKKGSEVIDKYLIY